MIHRALFIVLSLLCIFTPGRAINAQVTPDATIRPGDTFNGRIAFPSDQDFIVFESLAGAQFGATLKALGTSTLLPSITIIDLTTEANLALTGFVKGTGTKSITISKLILPSTGSYLIVLGSSDGSTGNYSLKTSGKLAKTATSIKSEFSLNAAGDTTILFPAFQGATFTAIVEPSKGSSALPSVAGLVPPSGGLTSLTTFQTINKNRITIKNAPVAEFGIQGLKVSNGGATGNVKVTLTIKQPKFTKTTTTEPDEPLNPGSIAGSVQVQPLPAILEAEPNNTLQNDQFVGLVEPGKVIRIFGSCSTANDAADLFRCVIKESQTISITLLHDINDDFDFRILDTISGECFPGLSFATENEPETGIIDFTFSGSGEAEFDIFVAPFAGSGNYILTVVCAPFAGGASAGAMTPSNDAGLLHMSRSLLAGNPPVREICSATLQDGIMELDREFVSGEFVVQLKNTADSPAEWAARNGLGVRVASPGGAFVASVPGIAHGAAAPRADRLETMRRKQLARRNRDVDFTEPNYIYRPAGAANFDNTPNDPFFNLQWHYPKIKLPEAWGITKGSANVIVAILDTGITAHPDLVARDSGTGFDMISDPQIANDGNGVDNNPTDPGDLSDQGQSSWHGTHVAGTVGASTNNNIGVAGVDWFCKLMHVRVLGVGGGTNFDIGEGMKYAARLNNASGQLPVQRANVINMSLGGPGFSQNQQNIVNQVRAAGTALIAAAGNENSSQPSFPASYSGVISVAATDFANNRAPYSNFGVNIDIAAPGGNSGADLNQDNFADGVLSTLVNDSAQPFTFNFVFSQGTSMASPHVAGVAALLYSVAPTLTPDALETALTTTAVDLGTPGKDQFFGHGLVNAFAALQNVQVPDPGSNPNLVVSTNSANFGTAITQLTANIANTGGGTLTFTLSDSENSGGNWLSVSPTNGNSPQTITITVNRTGLQPGVFTGTVQINSNGGSASIAVAMEVASTGTVNLIVSPVFVLAVDIVTLETAGQATLAGNGTYTISDLPPGEYLIVAGADLDNDNAICGIGEPCGIFPTANDPLTVVLPSGGSITGIDFSVLEQFDLPSASAAGVVSPFLPVEKLKLLIQK